MKKIFVLMVMLFSLNISAQEFKAPAKGRTSTEKVDSTTTYTYRTNDDKIYKVFKSSKGAYYIWKTSKKSGKDYKMYLPKSIQKQMGRKYE